MEKDLLILKPKNTKQALDKLLIMLNNFVEDSYMFNKTRLPVLTDLLKAACEYKLSKTNLSSILLTYNDKMETNLLGSYVKRNNLDVVTLNKRFLESKTNVFYHLDTLFHEINHAINDNILDNHARKKGEYLQYTLSYAGSALFEFITFAEKYNLNFSIDYEHIISLHNALYQLNQNEKKACLYAYYDVQEIYSTFCNTITLKTRRLRKYFEKKHSDYIGHVNLNQEYRDDLTSLENKLYKKYNTMVSELRVALAQKIAKGEMSKFDYGTLNNLYKLCFDRNAEREMFGVALKNEDLTSMVMIVNHPCFVHNQENLDNIMNLAIKKNVPYGIIFKDLSNIDEEEILTSYK